MRLHSQTFRAFLVAVLFLAGTLEASDKLVIISPHWEGIRFEFGRAFSDWLERGERLGN